MSQACAVLKLEGIDALVVQDQRAADGCEKGVTAGFARLSAGALVDGLVCWLIRKQIDRAAGLVEAEHLLGNSLAECSIARGLRGVVHAARLASRIVGQP